MSEKELIDITLTDLWKEFNSIGDFWEKQEETIKEFKRIFIERALEAEQNMLIDCKRYCQENIGTLPIFPAALSHFLSAFSLASNINSTKLLHRSQTNKYGKCPYVFFFTLNILLINTSVSLFHQKKLLLPL